MENSNMKASWVVTVAALVIGMLAGFGITKAMTSDDTDKTKQQGSSAQAPTANTKAADLRASLVTLGVEHMILTNQAVDGALDGSPNATQTAAALYANGNNIGKAVGSVYGKDAETTFDSVWKLHLDQFVNYAVADSKGDAAAKATALSTIESGYTKPLAQYLAKANPNIDEAALESALGDHVKMTAQIIDDHVQAKYAEEASGLTEANQHIEGIFSSLAGAIVKQYPTKF